MDLTQVVAPLLVLVGSVCIAVLVILVIVLGTEESYKEPVLVWGGFIALV